jgi:methylated-DNA-protein-cysteine methyltransferase-like protein
MMEVDTERSFFERVYEVARQIPYGRVTTYGAIAGYIGAPKSARLVGWAMNKSLQQEPPVPAHRVVNRNGVLTGKNHFPHPNMMQEMLENEGVQVEDDQVQDFEEVFWDPAELIEE